MRRGCLTLVVLFCFSLPGNGQTVKATSPASSQTGRDGVVFISSATDQTGISNVGGVTSVVSDNHLQLGWETTANAQVQSWLAQ